MQMFSSSRKTEPTTATPPPAPAKPAAQPAPAAAPAASNGASSANRSTTPARSGGILSSGVSIKGSVKCQNQLLIDGAVEGTIDSQGPLTIGEHAKISGEVHAKSVVVRGTIDGDIFATERCELTAGCTLRGDIEAPRLVVDENATFLGSAKIATKK